MYVAVGHSVVLLDRLSGTKEDAEVRRCVYQEVERLGRYGDLLGTVHFVGLAEELAEEGNVQGIVGYLEEAGRCVVLGGG